MPASRRERFSLGRHASPLCTFDPPIMRIDSDVRRCVVFIGHGADDGNVFQAAGTGFFLAQDNFRYLVTAQHIAAGLGEDPFMVRINTTHGTSHGVHCDPATDETLRWISHPDPSVDLAVMFWQFAEEDGMDMLAINSDLLLSDAALSEHEINVGDACHAIGLFQLLQGSQRNVPIVHTGHLALMAGEEPIPVQDWREKGKRQHVNCHLLEMQQLKGLSGAPVFVRPAFQGAAATYTRHGATATLGPPAYFMGRGPDTFMLGVWASSWDAPPDEVASVLYGKDRRVPIGLGSVVPAARLIEILQMPDLKQRKDEWLAIRRAKQAAVAATIPDGLVD